MLMTTSLTATAGLVTFETYTGSFGVSTDGVASTGDTRTISASIPAGSTITELGIEREGLRGDWLTINAKMGIEGGTEEDGLAGIYLTKVPKK